MTADRKPLTKKQNRVYRWIRKYIEANQRPPTRRETADHFGWSGPNSVMCHLKYMERKGWLAIDDTKANGIRLTGVKVTITDLE